MILNNKYKKWILLLLPLYLILLFILGIINYTVDPYGFFRKDFTQQLVEPSQNFLKMRYITNTNTKFNSFVFGSSRVGKIYIQNIHNNGIWYNMTYAGGLPQEHRANIEYMINRGIKIKELLIGLDEFSFLIDPESHLQLWTTKPYSPVLGESEKWFYFKYIFRFPDLNVFQVAYKEYKKRKSPKDKERMGSFSGYDFYGSGQLYVKTVDYEIDLNPEKHIKNPSFLIPYKPNGYETDCMNSALSSIQRIVDMCRTNGIRLTIFINPIYHVTYKAIQHERFFSFKRKLSQICDYYDFSGLNSVTENNFYYYEPSHYRPIVGDMIINRIFDKKSQTDFGILVTASTVEKYLQEHKENVSNYEKNKHIVHD